MAVLADFLPNRHEQRDAVIEIYWNHYTSWQSNIYVTVTSLYRFSSLPSVCTRILREPLTPKPLSRHRGRIHYYELLICLYHPAMLENQSKSHASKS